MKRILLGFFLMAASALAAVPGDPAPDWHFTTLDGRTVSAADFKGKVVVIDFWATWCGPCKKEIPHFVALQKKYGAEGLVILGVSIDAGPEPVRHYVSDREINYTIGMSNDQIYAAFNSPDVVPTTFLIDRKGIIRDCKLGEASEAAYEKKVVACLHASG